MNDTVRVNGRVTIADKEELERRDVEVSLYEIDDRSMHLQGIIIEVERVIRPLSPGAALLHLWNTEEIAANQAKRPISERSTNS